jgi:diguanylate cyclase (GGDEF)-like protein
MTARRRSLSAQLTWITIAAAGVFLVSLALFGWWAVSRIDERSLERETSFARIGLEELAARLTKEQDSSAIWDDAVTNVRAANEAWIDENLVLWMSEYYGHDRVFVLDPENEPIRAAADGLTAELSVYETVRPFVEPIAKRLRTVMSEAATNEEDSTEAITGLGELDTVAMGDGLAAIISVRPVVPSSDAVTQAPGTEFLHVSMRFLDADVLEEIQSKFSLHDLTFEIGVSPGPGRANWPVFDSAGRIVGFLAWLPDRPASELIRQTALTGSLALIALALGIALLLVRIRRTSSKLEVSEAHAQYLAFHDPLTGVPNRGLFEDRLERALANMRRTRKMVALHYIDLDRFKHINDTLGHPAGDALIRAAAERLTGLIREVDTIARLGGDEFAIVQVEAGDQKAAETLSERIVEELQRPFDLAGDEALVGASVGLVLTNEPETTPADMMRQADIALYEAKANGRGRFEVFAADLGETVRDRRQLERDLRGALQGDGGLHLVYQPIYEAASGRLVGAEALVRWDHPSRGLLAPDVFIGLAEERGLIEPLGLWVLRTACRFAATSSIPWVAVNVSPLQFRDEHLSKRILDVLKECGLPPRRLEIEITEGLLLQNSPVVQATLMRLRAAGVRVALDDFGTGYSSISYLRTYGVDKLKIDRSFVNQLGEGKDIDSIVRSIIDLARAMHMHVTAEGVESDAQRNLLIAMGCNQVQGFLLSRPVSPERLKDMAEPPTPSNLASVG